MNKYLFKDIVVGNEGLLKGPFGSDLKKSFYVPKGKNTYKVYLQENILKEDNTVGEHYISKEYFNKKMSRYEIKENDFIVTCDGTLGEIFQLKDVKEKGIISSSLLRITLNNEIVDSNYFYYLFKIVIKKALITKGNNSVLKHLPGVNIIRNYVVELPDINIQRKIGSVLKIIDNKIKNNLIICKELQQIVKTIYDYWFLQFEFPNEEGKPYKSSGGKMVWNEQLNKEIPEGWKCGIIKDIGEVIAGGTPSTKHLEYYTDNGISWITPKDLAETTNKYICKGERDITELGLKNSSANLLPKGTILLTSRAPIGYIGIATKEVATNQGFKSIVPKNGYDSEYIYYTIKSMVRYLKNLGVGSTFSEISKETVENVKVIIPMNDIIEQFKKKINKIASRQEILERENEELMKLRDFLLPLLMNGQLKFVEK